MLDKAGARIYAIVLLTGAFGLRMGEAVALKAEDVDIQAEIPKLRVTGDTPGNRKSPGDVNLTETPNLETYKYIRGLHMISIRKSIKSM